MALVSFLAPWDKILFTQPATIENVVPHVPRSFDHIYTGTYYLKWVKTTWTDITCIMQLFFFMLLKCIEPNEPSTFMAYILDGNSETGTNVLSKIGFMICLRSFDRHQLQIWNLI